MRKALTSTEVERPSVPADGTSLDVVRKVLTSTEVERRKLVRISPVAW